MEKSCRSDCWYSSVCSVKDCDGCERYMEMLYLMQSSGLPKARQMPVELIPEAVDYESFCDLKDIKDSICDWVNAGKNLYICSSHTGNGKTSWAIKMMLKFFDSVWAGNGFRIRGLFVHVPTLLLKLKDFDNPMLKSYRDSLIKADLVIWDDIAHTDTSRYDYTNLLMYIDNRIFEGRSNIYTSNIATKKDLELCVGAKLASRIWNESHVVELVGKDRRNG